MGMIVIEYDSICDKNLVEEFTLFHGYLDFCFKFERNDELNRLRLLQITENEKEKLKLEAYDKFISENTGKFVNEFNIRFNKYKIYEIYIEL